MEQTQVGPHEFISTALTSDQIELANEIRLEADENDFQRNRHIEELHRAIIRLRLNVVNGNLLQLRFLQEEAESEDDWRNLPYQNLVVQYTQMRDKLDRALGHIRLKTS